MQLSIKIDICAFFFHHWVCVCRQLVYAYEQVRYDYGYNNGNCFMQKHIDGIEETNILGKAKKKKRRSSVRILELQVGRSVAHKMCFACKWEQRIFLMYIA